MTPTEQRKRVQLWRCDCGAVMSSTQALNAHATGRSMCQRQGGITRFVPESLLLEALEAGRRDVSPPDQTPQERTVPDDRTTDAEQTSLSP